MEQKLPILRKIVYRPVSKSELTQITVSESQYLKAKQNIEEYPRKIASTPCLT